MSNARRIALLAQIELERRARTPRTWIAGGIFVLILAWGAWTYSHALPPRPEDDRLFGYAYLIALVVALHLGIARDRRFRFDAFLTCNLLPVAASYSAKVVAGLMCTALASVAAFVIAAFTSFGDFEYAAWYAILFLLVTLLFMPWLVLIELLLDIEYPVAIVGLLFTAGISILNRAVGAKAVLHAFALDIARFDYGDLTRLAVRAAVAILLTFALLPLYSLRVNPRSNRVLHR